MHDLGSTNDTRRTLILPPHIDAYLWTYAVQQDKQLPHTTEQEPSNTESVYRGMCWFRMNLALHSLMMRS